VPCDDLFRVSVSRRGRTGTLAWVGAPSIDDLSAGVQRAVDDAWVTGLERLVARVPAGDLTSRRALHRCGFRLEGIARAALAAGPDHADEAHYALLATDPVAGRVGSTAVLNTLMPRKRLIAHALLTDPSGRVALCETSFKPDWELPGGIVEPGESPRAGCVREMVEEMGFAATLTRVLVVDWRRPYLGWEDALELVFASVPLSRAEASGLRPDGREILAVHWVEPHEADARLTPFGAGRLRAALRARAEGNTAYLEGGAPA